MNRIKDTYEYFRFCFQKRNDVRFKKIIRSIGDAPELVDLKHYGEKNSEKPIYHILPGASGSGFFADFNRLLAYLYYADYFGLQPVIEFDPGFMYAEKEPVNGTTNPFEYYFEQPSRISLDDVYSSRCVIQSRKENAALAGRLNSSGYGYDFSDEYIKEMGRIVREYITLNSKTQEYFSLKTVLTDSKKYLGVHVRGTDFKRNYKGHPVSIPVEDYVSATKDLMKEGAYDFVFLATDDENALDTFKKTFGDRLCFNRDITRSAEDETVMRSQSDRENHHYKLGLEVLSDAYTLGRCDGLVAGVSQVSTAARFWKAADKEKYEDLRILFEGINHKGSTCT